MNVSGRWRNHRRSHQAKKKNKGQRQNDTISQQFVSLVSASTANDYRTRENHEQSSSFHLPLNLFSHVNVFAFLAFFLFIDIYFFPWINEWGRERQGISYCTLLGYFGPDDVWISMCLAMRLNVTQELQERHYSSGLDPSTNKTGNTFLHCLGVKGVEFKWRKNKRSRLTDRWNELRVFLCLDHQLRLWWKENEQRGDERGGK